MSAPVNVAYDVFYEDGWVWLGTLPGFFESYQLVIDKFPDQHESLAGLFEALQFFGEASSKGG